MIRGITRNDGMAKYMKSQQVISLDCGKRRLPVNSAFHLYLCNLRYRQ